MIKRSIKLGLQEIVFLEDKNLFCSYLFTYYSKLFEYGIFGIDLKCCACNCFTQKKTDSPFVEFEMCWNILDIKLTLYIHMPLQACYKISSFKSNKNFKSLIKTEWHVVFIVIVKQCINGISKSLCVKQLCTQNSLANMMYFKAGGSHKQLNMGAWKWNLCHW